MHKVNITIFLKFILIRANSNFLTPNRNEIIGHVTAIAMDCVTPTLKIKLNNIPTQEKRANPTGRAKK
ncbi:hypothetical protein B8043_08020 [Klebsiella aerogenes]|nr:hypothetical protein AM407_14025 [Klebsiella aerogenes]KJM46742.1 hypothetical protein SS20_09505 [Klebsiella aerogenes]KKY72597.1 hypothetical protein OA41_02310 [Klebsiella aerogenes]OVK41115.1 hypothetical protein B8043_08020 [Klebsiella aerogenes]